MLSVMERRGKTINLYRDYWDENYRRWFN